jgi:hypothetical protein
LKNASDTGQLLSGSAEERPFQEFLAGTSNIPDDDSPGEFFFAQVTLKRA